MDLEFAGIITLAVLSYVVPIALGMIGAFNVSNCPQQPLIPIYLGVCGLLMVAAQLPYLSHCESWAEGNPTRRSLLKVCKVVLFLVLGAWFIAGSVWVYTIYPPNYDSSGKAEYCGKTVYLIAFWFSNLCYILVPLALILGFYYVNRDSERSICPCLKSRTYTPIA
ncbi:hypothetical protein GJAV_G00197340 [Gymnothorax javanicus]|nr:hypothetical protein GJAV_G00197340 [Gymnothorax javanicus]